MSSGTAELKVTPRQMRKSVTNWLREEKATIEQALKLQVALYAGAIAGERYDGDRPSDTDYIEQVSKYQGRTGDIPEDPAGYESEDTSCGCLLDTLERIKGRRPVRGMPDASAQAFSLALMIGYGDTPYDSKWARAAVRGVEDYIAEKEAA
jgi:hypothetical protein